MNLDDHQVDNVLWTAKGHIPEKQLEYKHYWEVNQTTHEIWFHQQWWHEGEMVKNSASNLPVVNIADYIKSIKIMSASRARVKALKAQVGTLNQTGV